MVQGVLLLAIKEIEVNRVLTNLAGMLLMNT